MAETLGNLVRTHLCGTLREAHVGQLGVRLTPLLLILAPRGGERLFADRLHVLCRCQRSSRHQHSAQCPKESFHDRG